MRRLIFSLLAVLSCVSSGALAQDANTKALADKGLVVKGQYATLPAEQEFLDSMRDVRAVERKLKADTDNRRKLEQQADRAKGYAANLEFEKKRRQEALGRARTRSEYDKLNDEISQIDAEMAKAAQARADADGRIRSIGDDSRVEYLNKVTAAFEKGEKLKADYDALAADPAVKGALDAGKKKLGGADLATNLAAIKKMRGEVNSDRIKVSMERRVPQVDVTLNGKITRTFIVDSGASTVVMPGDMAEELGLVPGPNDPTVRSQLADGRIVEGKQMTLKSVKVGMFTVNDVECVVMPKTLVAVPTLLGNSFLKNFIFRLDPQAEELHLSQLQGAGDANKVKADPGANKVPPVQKEPGADATPTAPRPGDASAGEPGTPPPPVKPGDDAVADAGDRAKPPVPTPPRPGDSTAGDPVATPDKPAMDKPTPTDKATDNARRDKVLKYLEEEYARKLKSADWRERALAVISLARLPHVEVTDRLFELTDRDGHEVVRLMAWQAILSRAPGLSQQQHAKWIASTYTLAEKGAFKGSMRVALFDVLATAPANARTKKVVNDIFMAASAWEPNDIPTLRAMGRAIGVWHSGELVDLLISSMRDQNNCLRAEYVLQRAGIDVPTAQSRLPAGVWNPQSNDRIHVASDQLWQMVYNDYAAYIRKNRAKWGNLGKLPGEPWKELRPLHVPAPVSFAELDANEELFKADLELGKTNLKQFEVAFVVDASGSMQEVLNWLSRDILKTMAALGNMALEPRIGITFYRDQGEQFVTKTVPLTHKGADLVAAVKGTPAVGGGDVPEAVYDGLAEALNKNKWNPGRQEGGNVIVLIGDAPPKPDKVQATIDLVADARKTKNFKTYVAKVTTSHGANDLRDFDAIAQAGGTQAVEIAFGQLGQVRFVGEGGREIPLATIARPEAQLTVAPTPAVENPGEAILKAIIADAINPQYRDRLDPLVKTLLAWSEQASPKEVRLAFPANTPKLGEGNLKPQ